MLGLESYPSLFKAVIYAAVLIPSYVACIVVYRLCFHPLAHIPGPKLAALTFLYQTYHSFKDGSRFYKQVGLLHKKYGPIVRITPNEVSLSDPENYETIYYVGSKYAKDPRYYDAFGMEYASFTSCPNELHRLRRGPLNKFFSRAMVLELQSIVQEKADKLCALITRHSKAEEMLDIHHGCRAVSIDVITEYMFNKCYDLLDAPDLGTNFFELVRGIGPALWVFQQWPELSIMNGLPPWMLKKMSPPLAQILNLQEVCLPPNRTPPKSLLRFHLLTRIIARQTTNPRGQSRSRRRPSQQKRTHNNLPRTADAKSRRRLGPPNSRSDQI
jgi:hypothetical protein